MPEGPEVRTVADVLRPILVGKVITAGFKDDRAKSIGFDNLKCPATIISVRSYGKKVIIDLDTGHMMVISLGMAGRVQFQAGNHSHIMFAIAENQIMGSFKVLRPFCGLYYEDPRYMGGVDIIPNAGVPLYFKDIGPDLLQLALDEKTWIPLDKWMEIYCQKRLMKRAICDVLLDQSLVAGIGNYVKCEVLYYAMVLPDRNVQAITIEEWERIRVSAHKVIRLSYSYGGLTIKSFISPDGQPGRYPKVVYGKTIDPMGNPVISGTTRDRRTSHWVPAIQR